MVRYIDTQQELEKLIAELKGSRFIAIDTEFMREKSYYAKLCLIQISNGKTDALIDVLAVDDLQVLAPLLRDERCEKVFHAAAQDIEVLYYATGSVPKPIFDTQVAASVLGYPLQVGYGPLVNSVCKVRLPKADGYTDWTKRPLSKTQRQYAIDDVVYLVKIYEAFQEELRKKGRSMWLKDDFKHLCDKSRFVAEPREMYKHVKRASSLSRRQLAIAREVAAWREEEAMKRDLPRRWILADEAVVEIARKAPMTKERLFEIRGMEGHLNKRSVKRILECVIRAKYLSQDELPVPAKSKRGEPKVGGAVDLMAALVDLRSHENEVASPALASRDDLTKLARGHKDESSLLHGWRYEMVGRELIDLLEGRLSLRIHDGHIEVIR